MIIELTMQVLKNAQPFKIGSQHSKKESTWILEYEVFAIFLLI